MTQIGAQMYTLRDSCGNTDEIARSLEKVKAMGYDGIQASSAGFNTLDETELKQIKQALDDNGLICGASHESLENMRDHTEATITTSSRSRRERVAAWRIRSICSLIELSFSM